MAGVSKAFGDVTHQTRGREMASVVWGLVPIEVTLRQSREFAATIKSLDCRSCRVLRAFACISCPYLARDICVWFAAFGRVFVSRSDSARA
eukprot:1210540-Pleurochrysis_carterae.AAC.2